MSTVSIGNVAAMLLYPTRRYAAAPSVPAPAGRARVPYDPLGTLFAMAPEGGFGLPTLPEGALAVASATAIRIRRRVINGRAHAAQRTRIRKQLHDSP